MPTVLITGANRGIGLELARQYAGSGWRVLATCRTPAVAGELAGLCGDVSVERLDMLDRPGIAALAERLQGAAIDLLFLNAGVNPQHGATLADTDYDRWGESFEANVIGPFYTASTFAVHVARSQRKIIVAMGSLAGSFKASMPANYLYRSTKVALHNIMKALADDLRARGVIVVVMHPGRVRGARTPNNPTPVEVSVAGLRNVIERLTPEMSGRFLSFEGQELPW